MKSIKRYWRELLIVLLLMIFAINSINKPTAEPQRIITKEVPVVVVDEPKWQGFDSLSFGEAFNQMYLLYGEGHLFDWRGKVYLTKLRKES
tara:strand:+ start:1746 stop:2018 length:273 start_codon:yes stop_codon:yes gene_type:complete